MKIATTKGTEKKVISITKLLKTKTKRATRRAFNATKLPQTKDYNRFIFLENQRGKKESIDKDRVAKIVKMIEDGNYYDISPIIINRLGYVIDGHHRILAMMHLGLPITYYVAQHKALQTSDITELLTIISFINSYNPQWSQIETFMTALGGQFDLALRINDLRVDFANIIDIDVKKVKVSWIYSLITKNAKLFNGSKVLNNISVFNDADSVVHTTTQEFKNDFKVLSDVMLTIQNTDAKVRMYKVVGEIMKLYWSQINFDVYKLLSAINKNGISIDGTVNDLRVDLQSLYNVRKQKSYTLLYDDKVRPSRVSSKYIASYLMTK